MPWLLLADGVVLVHGAFLAYVVFGGLVALRWPRTLPLHAAAAVWGLLVILASVRCPLTTAEDWLRVRGGAAPLPGGFIDRYVEGVLYPERLTPLVQLGAAALVLGSWAILLSRSRSRAPAAWHRRPVREGRARPPGTRR